MRAAVNVLIAIGTAVVIYLGALHALSGQLTIGDLIVFATYLASLYAPINQMFQTYGLVQSARRGCGGAWNCSQIEPDIKDRPGARALGRARGDIEFDEVVFGYDAGESGFEGRQLSRRRAARRSRSSDRAARAKPPWQSAGALL